MDDILLIYDSTHTHIQTLLHDFNTIHPKLKFTVETESNNMINYLDITIYRTSTHWKTSVYRKPTFTDTIIPHTSNHPTQHKYAAVKFLYNRLNTYDLQGDEYRQENIIHYIMHNNSFPIHPPTKETPAEHTSNSMQMGHIHIRGERRQPSSPIRSEEPT